MIKALIKKLIPESLLSTYHLVVAHVAAFMHGYPSSNLHVIGITGTKGKSTTTLLAGRILEADGYKVGWIGSLSIKIGKKETMNPYHMTMPGRFKLQRALRNMVKVNCEVAIIETTSEGIKQFRHKGIHYDTVVFTNLTPEHIEAHGGFQNYKNAKLTIFRELASRNRKMLYGAPSDQAIVANLDDKHSKSFLAPRADEKHGFTIMRKVGKGTVLTKLSKLKYSAKGISFEYEKLKYNTRLVGKFNASNIAAALAVAKRFDIKPAVSKKALTGVNLIPGRMEVIAEGQPFSVVVDLAHTPGSFEAVLSTLKSETKGKLITLAGAAGGGRDTWKRPELGKLAAKYSDILILANEDPYNEDPESIVEDIKKGIENADTREKKKTLLTILDRRKAIRKAFSLAKRGDTVALLGKGTEQTMVLRDGSHPWDERKVARQLLKKWREKK